MILNHCHSHMFISEMIAIKLISVDMTFKIRIMMWASIDKSTLRHVIPFGRPKLVYKSNVKMPFHGCEMAIWPWRSRLMTPVCSASQVKRISRCIFGANLIILAQIRFKLLCEQAKFPRILSRNGQNDPEVQGQWPLFSIPDKSIPWCI